MANTRANAETNEEEKVDQEVPLQVPPKDPLQPPIDHIGKNVTHVYYRFVIQLMAQSVVAQANKEVVTFVNPNVNSTTLRVNKIIKMKPLEFYVSIVGFYT